MAGSVLQMFGFLLVLGMIHTGSAAAAGSSRNTRQASRCSIGQQCILLTACPELLALLNPPTSAGVRRLQSLTCAFDRRNPKVCCDRSTAVGPTPDPVTPDPVTPEPVTPRPGGNSNLLPDNCGAIGDRVIGGEELPLQSYQWMALIGFGRRTDPEWGCGGSLISQRYVITAAHCHDKRYNGGQTIVRVRLGEHDISKSRDCKQLNTQQICNPTVQDFNPEQIIVHPTWNKRTNYSDDIALIRLDRPAQLDRNVAPICLPAPSLDVGSFLNGRPAEVAGWGQTETGRHSDVKLMVQLPFVPLNECRTTNHLPLLQKGQLCFGGELGKDSCRGDSGGPLVGTDTDPAVSNVFVLLGVVSYGPPLPTCGNENRPAVYTEVAQYKNWIVNNLRP